MVLDSFVRALDGFEAALAGVAPGRWDAPSPCEGWSAADVAGHVIGDLQAVKGFATWRDEDNGIADPRCAAGDDPVAEWRAERARMMAALDPAALARPVPLPWGGQMPLGEWLERYPMEFLVHTWDLAQATGQAVVLDPGLVHEALGPARQFAPIARMSGLIGPECAVADDADDLTRLLAIFGRRNLRRLKPPQRLPPQQPHLAGQFRIGKPVDGAQGAAHLLIETAGRDVHVLSLDLEPIAAAGPGPVRGGPQQR